MFDRAIAKSSEYAREWAHNQTESKEDMLRFIHHATDKRRFPCDTIEDYVGKLLAKKCFKLK